jgi:DNA-binding response OmpR family regulator
VNDTTKTPLLVVDDDRAIRKLLERIARRAGFEVDTANDGAEALEMLKQKEYAVAIVDLMMPRVSGYELVQLISTLDPRPAVIVATALTNGDVANLDDSMVRRVIRKPFDVTAVASALIETARQVADQRAAAAATAATPVIPLGPEPPSTPDEPAVAPPPEQKPPADDAKS